MSNDESKKYAVSNRFWRQTVDRNLRRRLRLRADELQMKHEADGCVHDAVEVVLNPIFDTHRIDAIRQNRRLALASALVAGGLATWLTLAPATDLAFEAATSVLAGAVLLFGVFGWAAWKFTHDPGLPAVLTPEKVDHLAASLDQLGERGRPMFGVWASIGTFLLVSAEMLVVLLLSREAMLATLKPIHGYFVCLALALACGTVLTELVHYLARALRRGSVRDLQSRLAESKKPADQHKAELMQQAYSAGVGGHWLLGSRLVGHTLRCYREAIGWATVLLMTFLGTVALRIAIASGDEGELIALAITGLIAAGTLLIATKRLADACDLTEEVSTARRVVDQFPDGDHLTAHVARTEGAVRGRLREAQLLMESAWTPRAATQGPLSIDVTNMFDAELAFRKTSRAAPMADAFLSAGDRPNGLVVHSGLDDQGPDRAAAH